MTSLPARFLSLPIAHRGLHDDARGRPENSLSAFQAAIDVGYAIEIDIQGSRDGIAMVFHDYDLGRLTPESGAVHLRSGKELSGIQLGASGNTIPTLCDVLKLVDGKVPVLVEIKDQDGALGSNVGPLEASVAQAVSGYSGELAIMSFNPNSVGAIAHLLPSVPIGLVTCGYSEENWTFLSKKKRAELRTIPDFERVGADFISHHAKDLDCPRVAEIRSGGAPVLCWTIKNVAAEVEARKRSDNITFEGYLPKIGVT